MYSRRVCVVTSVPFANVYWVSKVRQAVDWYHLMTMNPPSTVLPTPDSVKTAQPHQSMLNPNLLNQHWLFRAMEGNRFCARIVDPFLFDRQRGKGIQYFVAVAELAEIGVFAV